MRSNLINLMLILFFTFLLGCGGGGVTSKPNNTGSAFSISGTIKLNGNALPEIPVILAGSTSATTITDGSGHFSFTGAQNGKYTITPRKTGFFFSPTSQSIAINSANATNQNFTAKRLLF